MLSLEDSSCTPPMRLQAVYMLFIYRAQLFRRVLAFHRLPLSFYDFFPIGFSSLSITTMHFLETVK